MMERDRLTLVSIVLAGGSWGSRTGSWGRLAGNDTFLSRGVGSGRGRLGVGAGAGAGAAGQLADETAEATES
jgi:hypothetical protein